MHIVQIVLEPASLFEKKCQSVDAQALGAKHQITIWSGAPDSLRSGNTQISAGQAAESLQKIGAEVVHIYGAGVISRSLARQRAAPAFSAGTAVRPAWPWSREITVHDASLARVPEAVHADYFEIAGTEPAGAIAGALVHTGARRRWIDAARNRVARFREDIEWRLFDHPPRAQEMRGIGVWIDAAAGETDLDGYTAEALAAGRMLIAARTPANEERLDDGRAGFLVPIGDANELTHVLLTALFKPEVGAPRREHARSVAARFRPERRAEKLLQLYEAARR